jgi:hypothetical protein
MHRFSLPVWALAGFVAGGVGWSLGGLIGSFLPQTIAATAATGAAVGLLARLPRTALAAALAAGLTAAVFFLAGGRVLSPLLAWPAAALAIGLIAAAFPQGRRQQIISVLAAPLLGSIGMVAGAAALFLTGIAVNSSHILGHFMWGGAAGFGLLTAASLRIAGARWASKGGGTS